MSTAEILEELPHLARAEREKILRLLEELELAEVEETPEMLAAIEAGRQCMREGRTHTVEEARRLVAQWTAKSS
jgi:predicted transcriptional regulator